MRIRNARPDDLAKLVEIERAAGQSFRPLDANLFADHDPGSVETLTPYADGGRAFVSVDADDRPVGYLLVDPVDGAAHIEQVSVHPEHAGKGIGRALIEHAASWPSLHDLRSLTLTTYVGVPWNGQYYERLGFRYLTADEETPWLRAIREHGRELGLEVWPRASMRRSLANDAGSVSADRYTIRWHRGPRSELRSLFGLADESDERIDSYIDLGRVLVAIDNRGRIVGHLQLAPDAQPDVTRIENLAVDPRFQRRGIGSRLVDRAIAVCRAEGARTVTVATAMADIDNLRFYQRRGFRAASIVRDAFTPENGYPAAPAVDGIPLRDGIRFELALDEDADRRSEER
ncbi:MAG: GNAT family N-acetyltransferase [Verrucomicrobiota bacterium]